MHALMRQKITCARRHALWVLLLFVLGTGISHAQSPADDDACPALVAVALERTEQNCQSAGSNELCYGHVSLEADPQGGVDALNLVQPGDVEDVTRVRAVRLSAMDTRLDLWGVALMQVRALLRETPLGDALIQPEDVTFILFGDVALDNDVPVVEARVRRDANIRAQPSTDAAILRGLVADQRVLVDGSVADRRWFRVRLPGQDNIGWVAADLLSLPTDLSDLPVLDPRAPASLFGGMQAFYLRSGVDDAPCSAAPNSGMLIQTAEGAAEVTLLMNEANIQLRATAFVQAQPGDAMTLYVLEGAATVEAAGVQHTLIPGTSLTVPLDDDGRAAGPPSEPAPYNLDALQALPVTLLNREVVAPPPAVVRAGVPAGGVWNFFWGAESALCGSEVIQFSNEQPATTITVENDGESMVMLLTRYTRVAPGQYATVFEDATGYLHRQTITVSGYDRMTGQTQIEHPLFGCEAQITFTLTLVRPSGN